MTSAEIGLFWIDPGDKVLRLGKILEPIGELSRFKWSVPVVSVVRTQGP